VWDPPVRYEGCFAASFTPLDNPGVGVALPNRLALISRMSRLTVGRTPESGCEPWRGQPGRTTPVPRRGVTPSVARRAERWTFGDSAREPVASVWSIAAPSFSLAPSISYRSMGFIGLRTACSPFARTGSLDAEFR